MWESLSSVNWGDVALWCAVIVLILVGIAGTIVPALPGHPMIFAGGWLAAWIGDYQEIGWVTLVILGVLTVIGFAVDWVAQTMGAQKAGATKYGTAGALIGTIAGLFMGMFGILFMPLIGAFIGEFIAQRNLKVAGNVGIATWIGMMVGSALKIALAFMMTGIICFALWF
ncbi:DUF456 domain-containing protein [Duodenibacillus massiliensis]|uniref:DUF456 domain-containing protein n=1 Tax=Duodenibacillus massiliensis TaxID=1852381 RepID=UPI003077BF61